MARQLTFGLGRNDRTQAIIDGSIALADCEVIIDRSPHEELFRLALDEQRHDVTELSLANYTMLRSAKGCGYVALPVFTSRMFRHAAIYVRDDRGVQVPGDLNGKTLGLREFSNTATVTAKGLLSDDYGVKQESIVWRVGRVNRGEQAPILRRIPADVSARPIGPDENLSDLLALGELDGVVAYDPPACFLEGRPHVRRLFPDHARAERDYFSRTRIFPIMHLIVIRRSLADDGALCAQICDAFEVAKRLAFEDLCNPRALPIMLPWLEQAIAQAQEILGADYWPYGVDVNRAALSATTRWLWEQKLIDAPIEPDRLFAPSILNWRPQHAAVVATTN
ncbi:MULTISPECIES: hypothetical protein [unclassified Beijerinckia]|uniref:hypothetical protein n=1 Tax=unclassified Beijerinckia TaxID=2638183 RepID=UPI00089A4540|nr:MULTISPECIES: hypothetical protein [unclassified Beijerinckia]MDH7798827.1 4,5-dihydroxyphthalate decarboxylase [Beijerinckia sp. GAS462]SED89619.1 4,5-dihydroxyphthalate decarboxylase [Beijerinckia sp. 28-YEA-48]